MLLGTLHSYSSEVSLTHDVSAEQRDIRLCPRLRVISGESPNHCRNPWVGILAPGYGCISRDGLRHTKLESSIGCNFGSRIAFGAVVLVSVTKPREAREE